MGTVRRAPGELFQPAYHRSHHSLDDQIGAGVKFRVRRILRLQEPFPFHANQPFQRIFTVDQSDDYLIRLRRGSGFDHDDVTFEDARVFHRISANPQSKTTRLRFEPQCYFIHVHVGFGPRIYDPLWRSCRDLPIERDCESIGLPGFPPGRSDYVDLPGSTVRAPDNAFRFQCQQVPLDGVWTAEAEIFLNFGDGWRTPLTPPEIDDVIQNLLLSAGEHL